MPQKTKQCEAATGAQAYIESLAGWGAELADDAATVSAVTGQEEIAAPAEALSWALTGVKALSQASRGDTYGAGATVGAAAASSLVGKANKIFSIGGKSQAAFNSAVSSTLGRVAGPAVENLIRCE